MLAPLAPKEALAFWDSKIQMGAGQFAKLSAEAKIHAFAISGIAKGDELSTVYNALRKSKAEGTTFEEFKKDAGDIFTRRGWTGKRAWRVDNIYRTNIQTAYNVGRYKQLKEMTDAFPLWQYSAVNDSRTRPTHLALNGKIFPANHPFWDNWYPPNGFRCRCSVLPLTAGQVARRKLTVETEDPTNTLIHPVSPVTGQLDPVPVQLLPDPGFAYHPGKSAYGGIVDAATERSAGGVWKPLPGLHGPADFKRILLADIESAKLPGLPADLLPAGRSDEFYKAEFVQRYGEEQVVKDAAGDSVILSLRSFLANKDTSAGEVWKFTKPGHGEIIPMLQEMIERPYEIWLTPQEDANGQVRMTRRYIGMWQAEDKSLGGLMSFEVADGVWQGVTAFAPTKKGLSNLRYLEEQRVGLLLYGR